MKYPNKKIQIGVMGSAADLKYSKDLERTADALGRYVAKKNCILVFGAEKDYDSLSTVASRAAKDEGGMTVGITYGKDKKIFDPTTADVLIASGLERGGGRELPLVLSCDVIICVSGGSGTLTEIAIAYQANIPIIVIKSSGGWSQRLEDQFLDDRKRVRIIPANSPEEAVDLAIRLSIDKN
ncbi:MAG: hypothetical protein KGL39_43490 [Patescibacteria group bacterium]|nr:hypothetical protein [Patescibacteria group bacterium]